MTDYEGLARTRLTQVKSTIAHSAKIAGRPPGDIALVAVSKTQSADAIAALIAAGQRIFGENRVSEAQAKFPALIAAHGAIALHLVGQLQSNKADEAVALFDVIHSVDRSSLVSAIARATDKIGRQPRCFIQINIGNEPQKGGCASRSLILPV